MVAETPTSYVFRLTPACLLCNTRSTTRTEASQSAQAFVAEVDPFGATLDFNFRPTVDRDHRMVAGWNRPGIIGRGNDVGDGPIELI